MPTYRSIVCAACDQCVKVAQALLESLFIDTTSDPRCLLGGWFYQPLAFTSGLVLIAAHISPFTHASLFSESVEVSWTQCMSILEFFGRCTPACNLTAQFLDALKQAVCETFPRAVSEVSGDVEEGKFFLQPA
jgi:hypothetical protein